MNPQIHAATLLRWDHPTRSEPKSPVFSSLIGSARKRRRMLLVSPTSSSKSSRCAISYTITKIITIVSKYVNNSVILVRIEIWSKLSKTYFSEETFGAIQVPLLRHKLLRQRLLQLPFWWWLPEPSNGRGSFETPQQCSLLYRSHCIKRTPVPSPHQILYIKVSRSFVRTSTFVRVHVMNSSNIYISGNTGKRHIIIMFTVYNNHIK